MPFWDKVLRSARISACVALPAAGIGWFRSRGWLAAHPSGAWFSGMETTYEPIFWAVVAAAGAFTVSFVVCTIAQMPPDPPSD
jgi:hypothetical protein